MASSVNEKKMTYPSQQIDSLDIFNNGNDGMIEIGSTFYFCRIGILNEIVQIM
jgi:hypothetical protein